MSDGLGRFFGTLGAYLLKVSDDVECNQIRIGMSLFREYLLQECQMPQKTYRGTTRCSFDWEPQEKIQLAMEKLSPMTWVPKCEDTFFHMSFAIGE